LTQKPILAKFGRIHQKESCTQSITHSLTHPAYLMHLDYLLSHAAVAIGSYLIIPKLWTVRIRRGDLLQHHNQQGANYRKEKTFTCFCYLLWNIGFILSLLYHYLLQLDSYYLWQKCSPGLTVLYPLRNIDIVTREHAGGSITWCVSSASTYLPNAMRHGHSYCY